VAPVRGDRHVCIKLPIAIHSFTFGLPGLDLECRVVGFLRELWDDHLRCLFRGQSET
jgi:hypothetical protein